MGTSDQTIMRAEKSSTHALSISVDTRGLVELKPFKLQ